MKIIMLMFLFSGSQATVSCVTIGTVTTSTFYSPFSSTPVKSHSYRPLKRPRLELEDVEEEGFSRDKELQTEPHDSTFNLGNSTVSEQSEMS